MPAKRKHLRERAANFLGGVKRVLQSLSPRKRRRTSEALARDSEKENVRPSVLGLMGPLRPSLFVKQKRSTSPSQISVDASADGHRSCTNGSDVFLASSPLTGSDDSARGPFPVPYGSYFYQNSRPTRPTAAPERFVHEFTLPPPRTRHATVEEVEDEDDPSPIAHSRNLSTDSLLSAFSNMTDDAFANAASSDPPTQDQYTQIYDAYTAPGKLREAPTIQSAQTALQNLNEFLRGKSRGKKGYKDPQLNPFVRHRCDGMKIFLGLYVDRRSKTYGHWGASALQAAVGMGRGTHCVRTLCKLARQYIADRTVLPINPYGAWKESLLADEDLAVDINLYLQEIGNNITAEKLVEYLARPEVMEKHGLTRSISVRTARCYLHKLGYRFTEPKRGQYSDGHERPDVTAYRDGIYVPQLKKLQERSWKFSREGLPEFGPHLDHRRVVIWYHDESIFYANDRRRRNWYHKDAPAKLFQKGDGHSYMVADYVSLDFGWSPTSRDGTKSARRYLKPGKNRDGYFTCEDICAQAKDMMDIVQEVYPDMDHVFVYDNATNHRKRADGSLSARKMPLRTPPVGKNWFTETSKVNGKSTKVRMEDGTFNGKPQSLYFPPGHTRAGVFKGIAVILQERGIDVTGLRVQCPNFHCAPPASDCCARRILFNQPDFVNVPSILETTCLDRGIKVLFLPKFHCELNFIEQCWGYAKRLYRLFPESSREDDLERNVRDALAGVPVEMMRRFGNRCIKFVDAYSKGLNGRQAAWAARKYRGHRMVPETILEELEEAGIY